MRLPELKSNKENRVRDLKICKLWLEGKLTNLDISSQLGVCERTIGRVIYRNRDVLNYDVKYEKLKRIKWLQSQIVRNKQDSRKDPADLQEQMRKELEGDKPLVDNSTKITQIIVNNEDVSERVENLAKNRITKSALQRIDT